LERWHVSPLPGPLVNSVLWRLEFESENVLSLDRILKLRQIEEKERINAGQLQTQVAPTQHIYISYYWPFKYLTGSAKYRYLPVTIGSIFGDQ